MRIALVSQAYPPETASGGISSQTYFKAHGLAELGHEVHVISHLGKIRQRPQYRDGLVNVRRIEGFDSLLCDQTEPVQWLTYSSAVAAELARLQQELPIDLIDFPEWACEGYVYLLNRRPWDRTAVAIHLHGPVVMFAHQIGWPAIDSTFYRVARHMEELTLQLADAVFSSSHCSAKWCADHYGLDPCTIPVLHTGVDTSLFRPHPAHRPARPTVLFVGQIAANKGVEVLLDACLAISSKIPNLRLRMLGRGEGPLVERLRKRAADAGKAELVELPGFVSREELPAEYARAHVLAAPSVYEGGPGFVYLEAMACGLPVIGCRGSGASEAIVGGETGLLIAPNDVRSTCDALLLLLGDEEIRARMARGAREHVMQTADSRDCVKRIEKFYTDTAARAVSSRN